MQTRYFALGLGVVYVLVGVLGFVPGQDPPADAPALSLDSLYKYLLGLFPVNILHTFVHLLVGLAGIAAYRRYADARLFARTIAVVFALLTVMGLIPGLKDTFGLIPLFGHDVWLHALTALAGAYFGWVAAPERDRVGRR